MFKKKKPYEFRYKFTTNFATGTSANKYILFSTPTPGIVMHQTKCSHRTTIRPHILVYLDQITVCYFLTVSFNVKSVELLATRPRKTSTCILCNLVPLLSKHLRYIYNRLLHIIYARAPITSSYSRWRNRMISLCLFSCIVDA